MDSKCRLCQQFDETIDHIISACPIMAKEQYVKWHYRVSAQLHFNICKETGVRMDKKHWYEHVPESAETNQGGKVTILWNQQVQTDKTIPSYKPDIIIRDNEKGTCMLIDVAISGDRNVITKAEKILKYKDLTIEIQRLVGLVSFEVVSLCLYALIPAFLPLTKAPLVVTVCKSPHLSRRVGLNLFNVIQSATFHSFLQLREQEEVARSKVRGVGRVWEGQSVVSPEIHLW